MAARSGTTTPIPGDGGAIYVEAGGTPEPLRRRDFRQHGLRPRRRHLRRSGRQGERQGRTHRQRQHREWQAQQPLHLRQQQSAAHHRRRRADHGRADRRQHQRLVAPCSLRAACRRITARISSRTIRTPFVFYTDQALTLCAKPTATLEGDKLTINDRKYVQYVCAACGRV